MTDSRKPVAEQVMVITGASSGIGLATALAAADQGAKVVLAARSQHTLESTVDHIRSKGGEAVAVIADVGMPEDVDRIATSAIQSFGRIDTWVNDAGVGTFGRIDDTEITDAHRLFETNFWGIVYGSLTALPHLRESNGTLINLGSEVSEEVMPLQGMYTASKHAVKGFSDALRLELEADGSPVKVVLIQPTAVDTPFPEHAANYLSQEPKLPTPMIDPEKVATAILEASVEPSNWVKVGLMAQMNTMMAKLAPALGEEMAKMQMGRMQRDEPPQHGRHGALYDASETGRIRGRGNENPADMKEAKQSNLRSA
jgi:short-subunit dehydrogenase